MLKALIRKELMELAALYSPRGKDGKPQKKLGAFGYFLLFLFIYASLGLSFGLVSYEISAIALVESGSWLYFSLMGIAALLTGVIGSALSTYSVLYLAGDNDTLLAMPIPPSRILLSRLVSVFLTAFICTSAVWLPGAIAYRIRLGRGAGLFSALLMTFPIVLLAAAIACAVGRIIAGISVRIRHKSLVLTAFMLLFLFAYYFGYARLIGALGEILTQIDRIGELMRTRLYPLYLLGRGSTGHLPSLLLFTLGALLLAAAAYLLLSRSFLRIATANRGEKKAVYREKTASRLSVREALFRKELRHFFTSPVYLMNMGLGLILLLIGGVFALIKANALRGYLAMGRELLSAAGASASPEEYLTVLIPLAVALLLSMCALTAPSISLEGRNIWIVQSLPVSPQTALSAKETFAIRLSAGPALFCAAVLCLVFRLGTLKLLAVWLFCLVYILFFADLGLCANLLRVNLNWTSETVPVKQGMSVAIVLFGGWLLCLIIGAGCWFLLPKTGDILYLVLWSAVLGAGFLVMRRYLMTRGAEKFADL